MIEDNRREFDVGAICDECNHEGMCQYEEHTRSGFRDCAMFCSKEKLVKEDSGDNVNRPNHYTSGDIEVIDYIRDKLSKEEFTGYCMGNVIKYVSRWKMKGGLEDLKKAEVYLRWAIENED